jgi:hypothetical protein
MSSRLPDEHPEARRGGATRADFGLVETGYDLMLSELGTVAGLLRIVHEAQTPAVDA